MTMARYSGVVQDGEGNAVPFATIEVRKEIPGQPLAALKSDRAGTVGKDNAFVGEADGSFFFHVVGGSYQIKATKDGEEYIRRYVPVGLGQETDTITSGLTQRVHTAAGAVDIAGDDADVIIVKKTVGAPTTANLPSAASRGGRPVTIVDGKGDALTNKITVTPVTGESVFATVDYQPIIDGNGGHVRLTPLEDGTGWF